MTSDRAADTGSVSGGEPGGDTSDQLRAAVAAARRSHGMHLTLPLVGPLQLPNAEELAFMAGIGALAATGVVEWPVALILVAGRLLSHSHRSRRLAAFGDALEHAT